MRESKAKQPHKTVTAIGDSIERAEHVSLPHTQPGPAGREHSVISQFTMTDSFHSAAGPDQSVPINHVSQQSRVGYVTAYPFSPSLLSVCLCASFLHCLHIMHSFVAPRVHLWHVGSFRGSNPCGCVTVLLTNVWRLSNHSFSHREARSGKYVFARRAACSKNHLKMGRLLRFVGFIREIS